jgi:hypothetical protein
MTTMLIAALSSGLAHANNCTPTDTVKAFAQAADVREANTLETLLHPEFRVVFSMSGSQDASLLPRATWFKMLGEGKIGGTPRSLTVHSSAQNAGVSTVQATLNGASGRFESVYTVLHTPSGCQIVQDAVVYTPPASK